MNGTRLFGLRGAVRCENDPADIELRVGELYDSMIGMNGIEESDIVSLTFSVTPDLDAANPAAALRKSGRAADVSLFCAAEPQVKGGLPGVVRTLMLAYASEGLQVRHPYLNGAEVLRPDRSAKK